MIALTSDTATTTSAALYWVWRGDLDQARVEIAKLSAEEQRAAHTVLLRLAVLVETVRFEGLAEKVAAAILTPDALPDGVDGFEIHGRPT
jgi:hypothetical protein